MKNVVRERIKSLLFIFACVTTGTVIGNVVYILLFQDIRTSYYGQSLSRILMIALLTTLCSLIYPNRAISRRKELLLASLHFILVCVIVLTLGITGEWFEVSNVWMIVGAILVCAAIFAGVYGAAEVRGRRLAAAMNERLKEMNGEDEEDSAPGKLDHNDRTDDKDGDHNSVC